MADRRFRRKQSPNERIASAMRELYDALMAPGTRRMSQSIEYADMLKDELMFQKIVDDDLNPL
jgi:hypothetical protein